MAAMEASPSGPDGIDNSNAPSVIGRPSEYGGISRDPDAVDAENFLVEYLSKIELTDERFLRGTPVYRVMERCGRVLHRHAEPNFAHSRKVKKIEKFISHSWQASSLLKLLTVQLFYNWKPAVFAGNLGALLGLILFSFGLLPGFTKGARWGVSPVYVGTWSLAFGLLSFLLAWFSWSPREMVFLDRLCIDQTDEEEKTQGVMNIGGCLKHSKNLLVILDDTYCGRLWCLFELAAFLKTHEDGRIFVQPMSLTLFVVVRLMQSALMWGCSIVLPWDHILTVPILIAGTCFYGWFVAMLIVRHNRRTELLKSQLQSFRFEESKCFCCSVNHVNPHTNVEVLCDRAIIRRCVQKWFASVENFERLVQTQVKDSLSLHQGCFCPYPLLIAAELPFLWSQMDAAAARFLQQNIPDGVSLVALGLCMLVLSPLVLGVTVISTRDCGRFCPQILRKCPTVFGALAAVSTQVVGQAILELCFTFLGPLLGVVVFFSLMVVPSVLVWRFANSQN